MSVKTINETTSLVVDTCCTCGVVHAIPKEMHDFCRIKGGFWYCPNGHHIGWNKKDSQSVNDELRKDIAQLKSRIALKDESIGSLSRSLSAQKGQATKLKNRIANGVCPCCHRSFENLRRHINTQHPEFVESEK